MPGIGKNYLIYKRQPRYRSDQLINTAEDLEAAESLIDQEVSKYLMKCLLDLESSEWQQMRAALYNAYYIRIMPEVK